ncbi:MAG: nuclear transport factor 2 family protein [Brevundimonas sp.]|nr:nuclear transport factor 2 family protein [Brevundimonas sp.]
MAELSEQDVKDFLSKWARAYDGASPAFFESFSDDTSVFTLSSPTRIDGLEEYKRGFEPYFVGGRSQILSPEIKVSGDMAVATFHNRVNVDNRISNSRTTVVLQRDGKGRTQIVHLHQSPLGTPAAVSGVGSADSVSLLEERVATAAAAVGTPK